MKIQSDQMQLLRFDPLGPIGRRLAAALRTGVGRVLVLLGVATSQLAFASTSIHFLASHLKTPEGTRFTFEPVVSSTDFAVAGLAGNEVSLLSPNADFFASSSGSSSSATFATLSSLTTAISGDWLLSYTEGSGAPARDYILHVSAGALGPNDLRNLTLTSAATQSGASPAFTWTVTSATRPVLSGEAATVSLVRPGPGVVGSIVFPQSSWSPGPVTAGDYEFAVSYQSPLTLLSIGSPTPVAGEAPVTNFAASASIVDAAVAPVTLNALPGDYNADGFVDAADYTVWRDRRGSPETLPNEAASPGAVDQADYAVWAANYHRPGASIGAIATPEPASGGLAIIAAALASRRSRRRTPRHRSDVRCDRERNG